MNSSDQKFKINKNFKPCIVEKDDELFPNGVFVFNVTKMQFFINENRELFPLTLASVAEHCRFSTNLNDTYLESEAIDISKPVILAEIAPNMYNLIDGHHRVEKASRMGIEYLPAFKLTAYQHITFLTTSSGYIAYIDYWNQKIDSIRRSNR